MLTTNSPKECRKIVNGMALAAEANEDGSWWWAEESRLIKLPTARNPVFDCRRQLRPEERKGESKKAERITMRTSKAPGSNLYSQQLNVDLEPHITRSVVSNGTLPIEPSTPPDKSQYSPVPSGGDDWI